MKILNKTIFILLTLLVSLEANELYIKKANKLKLSQNPYWTKLLHYENGKSIINEDDFFLSKEGKTNKKAELKRTITSFFKNKKFICKYPARFKWLKKRLEFPLDLPKCKELNNYISAVKDMSIIFTAERYNSPGSVFGHTFIKLNTSTIPYAINYAAKVPDNENTFLYAYRGINGKYKSRYKLLAFSTKEYEYKAQEFRDLIEFKLKFSKDQIENIIYHLYEIKDTTQDYYFISRNCSSELIKLLDLKDENSNLSKDLKYMSVPIDIVYLLENHKLISNITLQKSKLKIFYEYLKELNSQEKELLKKIVNFKTSINEFYYNSKLNIKSKNNIVNAAISYLEMKSTQGEFSQKLIHTLLKLITLKNKNKIKRESQKTIKLKNNPISNKFHKISFGKKFVNKRENQYEFSYRFLYRNRFDLLDKQKKYGTVELFDIKARVLNDKISLEKLNLINLEALPLSNSFFKESTNKISLGAKREFFEDKLYSYFNYGLGYNFSLNEYFNYELFSKASALYRNEELFSFSIEPALEFSYNNSFISILKYESSFYSNGQEAKNIFLSNYLKINKHSNIELLYSNKNDTNRYENISLNYNFFF